MMHRMRAILITIFIVVASIAVSQEAAEQADEEKTPLSVANLSLALSNEAYPVTTGDVYGLSYSYQGEIVEVDVIAGKRRNLNLGLFGSIDATGKTYFELKEEVEAVVSGIYPGSLPRFELITPGEFIIPVNIVNRGTTAITGWGLSRLGDIVEKLDIDEEYSVRSIRIRESSGSTRTYDLYDHIYGRDERANPSIKPGDEIIINYARVVADFSGEVVDPGYKELLESDNLDDIYRFIGGFEDTADPTRILRREIVDGRYTQSVYNWGDRDLFDDLGKRTEFVVSSETDPRNVIYIELNPGVIGSEAGDTSIKVDDSTASSEYNRIIYPIYDGITLSEVLRDNEELWTPLLNFRESFIIREGLAKPIPVNLEDVFDDANSMSNLRMKENDVLRIPSNIIYITVTGGVYNPGRYYYTPMKDATYYISLAGGINPEESSHRNVAIYDIRGESRDETVFIEPGDNILVVQDNMVYQFNRRFTTVAVGLSLLVSIVALIAALSN